MNINEWRYKVSQMRVKLMSLSNLDFSLDDKWKELEVLEKEVVDLLENKYMSPVTPIETMYGEKIYEGDCILQTLSMYGEEDVEIYGRVRTYNKIYVIDTGSKIVPLVRLDATNRLYFKKD